MVYVAVRVIVAFPTILLAKFAQTHCFDAQTRLQLKQMNLNGVLPLKEWLILRVEPTTFHVPKQNCRISDNLFAGC